MEHESHHNHHPHGTGTRWLDITLALSATIVSLVSLWLGLHSAHAMERLVAANSYPYLEQLRNTSTPADAPSFTPGRERVEYFFQNNGVGPARIDWVALTFKGQPMADLTALFSACCGAKTAAEFPGLNRRNGLAHTLLRPGATLSMFTWDQPAAPNPAFAALHRQMGDIKITTCYCSVFDECYISRPGGDKPQPVEACTPPATPFRPGFRDDS